MAIWLMQLLCPARHALCAVPYDPAAMTQAEVDAACAELMAAQGLQRWCGLCGSRDLRAEHAPTRYATLEEALPALREAEAKQALTRALFGNRS